MNIYFLGMCISMAIYIMVGAWVSRRIRTAEDYYVAGRRAPAFLIAGSLIASYTSTGMFMGDASTFFQGAFAPMII
ncbi:MAG: sodium:solute symporter family protein, partial [Eubacterium sp.]|nr:sodium:solute symporter family protein [Eubacterium sp.]